MLEFYGVVCWLDWRLFWVLILLIFDDWVLGCVSYCFLEFMELREIYVGRVVWWNCDFIRKFWDSFLRSVKLNL